MKKVINKKGLILEHMDEDSKNSKNNNFVIIDNNNNKNDQERTKSIVAKYSDSMSCEIGKEGVIFKKDDIAVEEKGVKKITTGKFMSTIDPKNIEIQECIGKGASGYVHKAIHKPNSKIIAIKSINIYDKEKRKQLKTDLLVLQENDSPYLVKFYGAFFNEGTVKLAIEYMDLGSLDKIIEKIKIKSPVSTPENILCKITKDVLHGLYYLHKKKHQIHRDLKPGNILINSEGEVKLTDFGISRALGNSSGFCNTFVGTNAYMSPERISGEEYSYSSDIWSLGLIVYELATGIFPYKFSNVLIDNIQSIIEGPEPTMPSNGMFSVELQDFISKCLKKNHKQRSSLKELFTHPWIIKYSDKEESIAEWLAFLNNMMYID